MRLDSRNVAVIAAGALLLSACSGGASGGTGASSDGASGVLVTADLYSGRQNPSWRLTESEASAVVRCVASASAAASAPSPSDSGLGFRAFLLTDLPSSVQYRGIRVTVSTVEATEKQGGTVVLGHCPDLYGLLRTSAEGHIGAEASAIPKG